MNFMLERKSRSYFIFILLFLAGALLFGGFLGWFHGRETKRAVMRREQAYVSALMTLKASPEDIAFVVSNEVVTEEGKDFLSKTGRTENTNLWWLPVVQKTTAIFLLIVFGGMILLGGILVGTTTHFLEEREKLYRGAERMISRFAEGDFKERLWRNETGALYQLFAAIDQLATALQSKIQTEQKTKEFLKDTVSDISHQLKTPVAALNMYAEIMSEEPENVEMIREFSDKSLQSLERMGQLISSLLKIMRMDAGSIIFEKADVHVSELAERAVGDLLTRAQREGKSIITEGDTGEIVRCDLEWTGEAVSNLVKNALDHTGEGGVIHVRWKRTPMLLILSVEDNGSGIDEEDIYHIFKRFYRSKKSADRRGVGLGLPLAKAILEGQGATLSVESRVGEGSTFTISFLTNP